MEALSMNAALEPADYTVPELDEAVEDIDDADVLAAMLEAEADGKDRKTAKATIEDRLERLRDGADAGNGHPSAPSEAPAATDDPTDHAANTDAGDAAGDDPDAADVEAAATALGLALPDDEQPEPVDIDQPVDVDRQLLANLIRIRDSLQDLTGRGGSFEARIRQLQAEVSDLQAYTAALEEFLDAEGTGQQLIESVQDDLAALTDEVEHLELVLARYGHTLEDVDDTLEEHEDRLEGTNDELVTLAENFEAHRDATNDRHASHEDRFDAVEGRLDEHDSIHETFEDRFDTVRGAVSDLEAAVESLESDLQTGFEDAADDRSALEARLDDLAETVATLEDAIDDVADDVADLDRSVGDAGRVDRRLAAIEDDLEALEEWRDQLGSAMMGGGQPSED